MISLPLSLSLLSLPHPQCSFTAISVIDIEESIIGSVNVCVWFVGGRGGEDSKYFSIEIANSQVAQPEILYIFVPVQ